MTPATLLEEAEMGVDSSPPVSELGCSDEEDPLSFSTRVESTAGVSISVHASLLGLDMSQNSPDETPCRVGKSLHLGPILEKCVGC